MVDEVITKQELIDAQKDAQSLDEFINGSDDQIVVTRLLKEYPTLANAIRQIYEKGGKFYPTLAEANADIANIRPDVYVITGDNGAYYKATAGAISLTKSPYDLLTQAKSYADANPLFKPKALTNSDNLNNILTAGYYTAFGNGNTPSLEKNYPTTRPGILQMLPIASGSTGTVGTQLYISDLGKIYWRSTNIDGNAWGVWKVIASEDEVSNLIKTAMQHKSVSSDTNINTLMDDDVFNILSSSQPTIAKGYPGDGIAYLGVLRVRKLLTGSGGTISNQVLYTVNNEVFYRSRNLDGNAWKPWTKLLNDNDISAISAGIEDVVNLSLKPLQDKVYFNENLDLMLRNPLNSCRIKLLGDSITWGMGSSAGSPTEPRNGTLSDVRNTIDTSVSKTWANLLRTWIAKVYGDTTVTQDQAGSGYTKRTMHAVWRDLMDSVIIRDRNGTEKDLATKLTFIEVANAGTVYGSVINLLSPTYPALRANEIELSIHGDNLTFVYQKWAVGDVNDKIEVYVDDVLHSTINYYDTTVTAQAEYRLDLTYGYHKIRFKNIATSSASYTRISGFKVDKKIWVQNEGIIGSTAASWLDRQLIEGSLTGHEDVVTLMLGTNDRAATGGINAYIKNIEQCIEKIKLISPNAQIILMSSTFAANENPTTYKYNMSDVDYVLSKLAHKHGLKFISHYKFTAQNLLDGESIWSDGLHLNDHGNRLYFENIVREIFNA